MEKRAAQGPASDGSKLGGDETLVAAISCGVLGSRDAVPVGMWIEYSVSEGGF